MLTIVYLGTGAAVPSAERDNTSLVVDDGAEVTLIDTSGSPLKRMLAAGIDARRLARVIITHEHADHTFGFPSLLQALWLYGREEPLPVFALDATWRVLDALVATYWPKGWTHGFALERRLLSADEPIVETSRLSMRTALGRHSVPTVGIRVESGAGSIVAYSSDTGPCESIARLADHSTLLIHESTFINGNEAEAAQFGHSTAGQAAAVAMRARAASLALIHFTPTPGATLDGLRDGAAAFQGSVDIPSDGDRVALP